MSRAPLRAHVEFWTGDSCTDNVAYPTGTYRGYYRGHTTLISMVCPQGMGMVMEAWTCLSVALGT